MRCTDCAENMQWNARTKVWTCPSCDWTVAQKNEWRAHLAAARRRLAEAKGPR